MHLLWLCIIDYYHDRDITAESLLQICIQDAADEDKNAGARREKKLARIRAKEAAKA